MKEKKAKKPYGERLERSIFLSLFSAFSIGFFTPYDFFVSNVSEINIPAQFVMISLITVSVIIFLLVFLLCFLTKGRANHICTCTVFAMTLGAYIQSNFLSVNLSIINGDKFEQSAIGVIVDLLFWAALIAVVFYAAKKYEKICAKAFTYVPIAVIIMETAAVSVSYVTTWTEVVVVNGGSDPLASTRQYVCTTMDLDEYSSDKNVIIIFADAYDSFYFDSTMEEYTDSLSEFDGFTYYTNTLGMYSATVEAIPYITTGQPLYFTELKTPCRNDRFFKNMYGSYKSNIYGLEEIINQDVMLNYADNYIEKNVTFSDCVQISRAFYKIAAFKSVPGIIKPLFYPKLDNFHIDYTFSEEADHKAYSYDDLDFYENIPDTIRITEEKCFKLIYIFGVHNPRNINAQLQRTADDEVSGPEQAAAVNKILGKYLASLKNAGVYENSEIFILADHGISEGYFMYPLLLYKPAGNAEEGIKISNAPISHADLYPTLLKVSGEEPEERTIFDIDEDEDRERYNSASDKYVTGNVKGDAVFR